MDLFGTLIAMKTYQICTLTVPRGEPKVPFHNLEATLIICHP
jgi:hypothetical protein